MLLVAVDDTDSPEGGCTTALAGPIQRLFPDLTPEDPPRLVRLNPNIPWKTRGNAAIALRFAGDLDLDEALARVRSLILRHAQHHARTSPGIVVSREAPPASVYRDAVTRVVERQEVDTVLAKLDARAWGGRGVIGSAAALAWPGERATWERIAYRAPSRWGTPRLVDAARVREVELRYPALFDSYDIRNEEVVCVPSGPDPVLWGLRGDDPLALEEASASLGPERPEHETLFRTNQGTDDHLVDRRAIDCGEYLSARVRGRVVARASETGGSVTFELADASGSLRCAAYPPTRGFRVIVRALSSGDEVTVCGGIHTGPDGRLTLGLEKLFVHRSTPRVAGPPTCANCARSMASAGATAGYRCKNCGTSQTEPRFAESLARPGWHEVPTCARRHLAMPLSRLEP